MIRRKWIVWLLLPVLALLASCSLPSKFSMYPGALSTDSTVQNDMAVILVGNAGPETINYLQFTHTSLPPINVRGIALSPRDVIAIPIPVGIKGLSLGVYTTRSRPGVTLLSGQEFNYVDVRTPKLDISAHGLHFIATLFPGQKENFSTVPNAVVLKEFQKRYPELAKLKPINFEWPR